MAWDDERDGHKFSRLDEPPAEQLIESGATFEASCRPKGVPPRIPRLEPDLSEQKSSDPLPDTDVLRVHPAAYLSQIFLGLG